MVGERLGQRRGGGDRIPGAHRRPAIDAPRAAASLPLMKMRSPTLSARCSRSPIGHSCSAKAQSRPRLSARRLGLISASLPRNCSLISFSIAATSMSSNADKHAEIDDVLEQLALPRVVVFAVADCGQRRADDGDVVAELRRRQSAWSSRRTDSRRARSRRCPRPRFAGSSRPSCRRRRGDRDGPCRRSAPRTRSAGPGCSTGRCCASSPGCPCAGSTWRTARWRWPSPIR